MLRNEDKFTDHVCANLLNCLCLLKGVREKQCFRKAQLFPQHFTGSLIFRDWKAGPGFPGHVGTPSTFFWSSPGGSLSLLQWLIVEECYIRRWFGTRPRLWPHGYTLAKRVTRIPLLWRISAPSDVTVIKHLPDTGEQRTGLVLGTKERFTVRLGLRLGPH